MAHKLHSQVIVKSAPNEKSLLLIWKSPAPSWRWESCFTASGKLLGTGGSDWSFVRPSRGRVGGMSRREGLHVHAWLHHVTVLRKPTQHVR